MLVMGVMLAVCTAPEPLVTEYSVAPPTGVMDSRQGPTPPLITTVNEPSAFEVAVPVPLLQVADTAPTTGAPTAAVPFRVRADPPPPPPPPPQAASNALPPNTRAAREILFKRMTVLLLEVKNMYHLIQHVHTSRTRPTMLSAIVMFQSIWS